MNVLDKVRKLCKENHITATKLEEDLSLSRGAIYKWKTSSPNAETLMALAKYFNVSASYFTEDYYEDSEASEYAQALMDNPELKVLFDAAKDVPKDVLQGVIAILEASKR